MSTPLATFWRVTHQIVVSGRTHKVRAYVNSTGAVSGGVTQIIYRDTTSHSWITANQQWLNRFYLIWSGSDWSASVSSLLEHFDGAVWNPVEANTFTVTPSATPSSFGFELILTLRDTAFKKLRILLQEPSEGQLFRTTVVPSSGSGQTYLQTYVGGNTDSGHTDDPFYWMQSRGGRYIAPSGGFVSEVNTTNKKTRRARGLG